MPSRETGVFQYRYSHCSPPVEERSLSILGVTVVHLSASESSYDVRMILSNGTVIRRSFPKTSDELEDLISAVEEIVDSAADRPRFVSPPPLLERMWEERDYYLRERRNEGCCAGRIRLLLRKMEERQVSMAKDEGVSLPVFLIPMTGDVREFRIR